ncbi:MAG: hypothetical protein ABIY50_01105, partial [Ignavibacteria bacterium]
EEFSEYYRLALANLGMAYLKYFELKYDEALVLLSNIIKHNFDILFRINLLRICIYIDTKEFDSAFSSLDSFRHFARTHKNVTERSKNDLLKICNNLDALARYKSGDKKIDLKLLRKTIMKDPPMFTNDLILEKVNEAVFEKVR